MKRALICVLVIIPVLAATLPAADTKAEEVLIPFGYKYTLDSGILQEQRTVYVSLPHGYQESEKRYPVLVLLDGSEYQLSMAALSSRDGNIQQLIIVTIVNTNRQRDLSVQPVEHWPESGGAPVFLKFITGELIPFIDGEFRTNGYRIFGGGSAGGTFTLYTFINANDFFDAYIAASPSPGFYGKYVENLLTEFLDQHPDMHKFLYMCPGEYDFPDSLVSTREIVEMMKTHAPEGLRWKYFEIPDKGHVPFVWLNLGLTELFRDFGFPVSRYLAEGEDGLKKHIASLSEEFRMELNENAVYPYRSYRDNISKLIGDGRFDDAVAVAKRAVAQYPDSFSTVYRLGQAYMYAGEKEQALQTFNKAVALAGTDGDRGLIDISLKQLAQR